MFGWLRRLTGRPSVPPGQTRLSERLQQAAGGVGPLAQPKPLPTGAAARVDSYMKVHIGPAEVAAPRTSVPAAPLQAPTARFPVCRVVVRIGQRGGTPAVHPPRSHRKDEARWIPPGGLMTVNGFDIPGGMVYVGGFLSGAPGGGWNADNPAPCLINPKLKVASDHVRTDVDMGYWPSYSDITSEHRLTYLTWLSTGKRDASFPVGYAFLYFYGLERRLLVDCPRPEEEALLVAEVERLRGIYASNGSFSGYSKQLLDVVELRRLSAGSSGLDAMKPDLTAAVRDLPMPVKIKLALHAVTGTPLDFEHAMAAMLTMQPYQGGIRPTISMSRTRAEYVELVRRRFAKRFPKGFILRDRKDSRLALGYRPASQHLDIEVRVEGVDHLPDPTTLTWTKMADLCIKAAEDLSPYAKAVGKDRSRADSLGAALVLPPDLADAGAVAPFRQWLDGLPVPVAEVPLKTLGRWCFGEGREASGLKQARDMSAMLARVGFGMEPDPSCGAEKPGAEVLLFRTADASGAVHAPSAAFHTAALVAAVLASAEPGPDGARVVSDLAARLHLGISEAVRLAARYRLMRGRSLPTGRLKALASKLSAEDRGAVASMAAAVAAACGEVDHATVAALERLHDAFGLERRGLYAVLHQGAAAAAARAAEPVVVEQPVSEGGRFRIPLPPTPPAAQDGDLVIDMAKVGAILRETREVAEVLAPIYEDDEPATVKPLVTAKQEEELRADRFDGLDADHARLLEALCSRASWARAEVEVKAREFGLMPDGAIETINEWAYDALGDELVEDGDPLSINVALLPDAPGEAA